MIRRIALALLAALLLVPAGVAEAARDTGSACPAAEVSDSDYGDTDAPTHDDNVDCAAWRQPPGLSFACTATAAAVLVDARAGR